MNNNSFKLILLSSISILLSACGGGGSSQSNEQNNVQDNDSTPTVARPQPRALGTNNWTNAKLIQTSSPMLNNIEIVGSKLIINVESADITQGAHLQIYLNTDNKPETGFQFEDEAWEESGVDFLIEDGDLFKSTANNTGWNWNVNIGAIDYTINTDTASAKIDLSILGDICNNLKIGVMTRDEFWDISTFSPASTQMQTLSVSYCNTQTIDTVNPEITLLGANPLNLNINDTFNDPGASATDNIDGDITSRIIPKSSVNTAIAGTYEVSYLVTDIAGNSTNISRMVIVSEDVTTEGIVIDGNTTDWNDIPTFSSSSNAIMKVSDDEEKLYILITSSNLGTNTQILIDTDNNVVTGLELSAQVNAWVAGADYMIENNDLDKSTSNTGWSWDYGITPIEYIKTSDTLEIAIKKSDFNSLANNIPMGFVSRTADWNVNYILPLQDLPVYTMQFANEVNPIRANDDSTTTENDTNVIINVLGNDISSTSSALSISLASQPSSGNAIISQNKIVYTPNTEFTGIVTFKYNVTDTNDNTDTATVKVIVTAPVVTNTAPEAKNDSVNTTENQTINIRVLNNDTDADGDLLTLVSVSNPPNGNAVRTGTSIDYTPASGFSGTETFTYNISDGNGGSDIATVTVIVNPLPNTAPVAKNDSATTIGINTKQIAVLDNDTDVDGDVLELISFTQPVNGVVTRLTPTSSVLTYTPVTITSGTDTFTYTIIDNNGGSDTATVTVTIPPNNFPDAVEDVSDVFFNKTKTINVLSNDTDPDGDTLSVQSIVQPPVGFARLNNNGTIFFNPQNNVGSISIIYTVTDGRGGTDIAVLTVSSTDPNDGNDAFPDISNEQVSTSRNTPIFINVLANDTDADGDVLVLDQVDQGANGTTAKVTRNGVLGVLYTPNPGFSGSDIFYYGVHDGFGHNGAGFVEVTVAQ